MDKSRFKEFDELLEKAHKAVRTLKEIYMEKYGLSAAHTDCLCFLLGSEGLTQSELTQMENMDKAQVSRVLKKLLDKNLVATDSEGTYKKKYYLTEEGRRIAREIEEKILQINSFVSDEITEEDIKAFYKVFGLIVNNLQGAAEISKEKKEF